MSIVRVRPDVRATAHDPTTNSQIALIPGAEFDSADPIVKAHPWAFQTDANEKSKPRVRSVGIEQATAAPGERRAR